MELQVTARGDKRQAGGVPIEVNMVEVASLRVRAHSCHPQTSGPAAKLSLYLSMAGPKHGRLLERRGLHTEAAYLSRLGSFAAMLEFLPSERKCTPVSQFSAYLRAVKEFVGDLLQAMPSFCFVPYLKARLQPHGDAMEREIHTMEGVATLIERACAVS